ncbi:adenosine 3'-phospho 5'-phosphosulfate transporter 1 [Microplitis mediator]|uniref:adenosine 3'-phospho 5'-phosphosulfate transporter 1 n=1 Tax=Microplitis mediator TaxID=375433 RepID=UPI002555D51A|nr:adenosine 3'-phospho 5'-phosphosulfate transporter 1 [Microplitis mediator]
MGNYVGNLIICALVFLSIGVIYGTTQIVKSLTENQSELFNAGSYNWIIRLSLNLLGYATILLPGYLIYKYVRHSKYLQRTGTGIISKLIHKCISGGGESGLLDTSDYIPAAKPQQDNFIKNDTFLLAYCFFGLQISYLTWGYFQEKIMTQEYVSSNGEKGHFKDSQFLVFVNRILAFTVSGLYLFIIKQPRHITPLYKYSYCSLSNILSSWCQYEALKFVSFPTQVLAKASKIIPVMIMGKLVSRKTYEYYEYVTAALISVGMTLFMLGSADDVNDKVTTISGVILLAGYMALDSFTSNWQEALSKEYGPTSIQMMCGVNLFSCLLTATSLLQQSGFTNSVCFLIKFPTFVIDCLLISICSATGQLFIFYTIKKFGAVTFSIIMTIRQGLAILLSCFIYDHQITIYGVIGILIVFGSIFLRNYCRNRVRALKKHRTENINIKD